MFDIYNNTKHVTSIAFLRMLHEQARNRELEALQRDLKDRAKGNCKTCYGRGYAGFSANGGIVVCGCTNRKGR